VEEIEVITESRRIGGEVQGRAAGEIPLVGPCLAQHPQQTPLKVR
jgi:hypothetical protein